MVFPSGSFTHLNPKVKEPGKWTSASERHELDPHQTQAGLEVSEGWNSVTGSGHGHTWRFVGLRNKRALNKVFSYTSASSWISQGLSCNLGSLGTLGYCLCFSLHFRTHEQLLRQWAGKGPKALASRVRVAWGLRDRSPQHVSPSTQMSLPVRLQLRLH